MSVSAAGAHATVLAKQVPAARHTAVGGHQQRRRCERGLVCVRADASAVQAGESSEPPVAGPSKAAKMRQVYITSAVDMLSYSFVFPLLPFFAQKCVHPPLVDLERAT